MSAIPGRADKGDGRRFVRVGGTIADFTDSAETLAYIGMRSALRTLYISSSIASNRADQEGERRFLVHHSLPGHPHPLVRGPTARYASRRCGFSTPMASRSA